MVEHAASSMDAEEGCKVVKGTENTTAQTELCLTEAQAHSTLG